MRWMAWILTLCLFCTLSVVEAKAEDSLAKETQAVAEETTALTQAVVAPEATKATKEIPKESEIALNLDKVQKPSEAGTSVFRVLFSLGLLAIVGVGAFFYLRKYAIPKSMKTQTQIKVLQQHYLGPKKSLAIIRVAGESLLIGVTDQNINMIKSLSLIDDEVPEETPQNFAGAMRSYDSAAPASSSSAQEGEDFSFGSIKDVVAKRLKGMRSLE